MPRKVGIDNTQGSQPVLPTGIVSALWRRYKYFFWTWFVLTAIVLIAYETQLDRERICTYQYCPSKLVLAICTGCMVLAMVWVDLFFGVIRPWLQWRVGKLFGTRVRSDLKSSSSILELFVSDGAKDFWEASPNATIFQHILVTFADLICVLLFVLLPVAAILSCTAGAAYVEQHYFSEMPPAAGPSAQ